jgi:hypothetical protein
VNLLSLLGLLGANGQDPQDPTREATVPTGAAPVPAQNPPFQMKDLPPAMQVLMGRASTGDKAAASAVAPLIEAQMRQRAATQLQQMKGQQEAARAQAFAQGVRGVQERLAANDVDGATMLLPGLSEMGLSESAIKSLQTVIDRHRTKLGAAKMADFYRAHPDLAAALEEGQITVEQALTRADERRKLREEQARADRPKTISTPGGGQALQDPASGAIIDPLLVPGQFSLSPGQTQFQQTPAGPQPVASVAPKADEGTKLTAGQIEDLGASGVRLNGRSRADEIQPQEWALVEARKRQARIDDKLSLVDAVRAGRENERVPTSELARYVEPGALTPARAGTTYKQLQELEGTGKLVHVDPTDVRAVKEFRSYEGPLKDMEASARKLLAMAPGKNLSTAVKLYVGRGLGDSDARVLTGYQQTLGLAVGAVLNKGRPTEADAEAVRALLPNETDTVQSAVEKLNRFRFIMKSREAALLNLPAPEPPRSGAPVQVAPGIQFTPKVR